MDLRQLRYFATIVEEGQITRAAKKLHMAQPLSQQLKALEEELSTLLIVRNGKNIELTAAGKVLYKRATNLLSQIDETIMEVKEVGEGLKGTLSIGSVKHAFLTYLNVFVFSEKSIQTLHFVYTKGIPIDYYKI